MKTTELASPANNHHYNKSLRVRAREMRNRSTKAEIILWDMMLKHSQLRGYQFLRQRPVLFYIADFMCFELMLIIEVDGMIHEFDEVAAKDARRQRELEAVGFTVLRFSNWEVLERRDLVMALLLDWILDWENKRREGGARTSMTHQNVTSLAAYCLLDLSQRM
ncbi:MAG: endonuclease domain-containing protein [Saprospiraceae bacterium]